MLACFFAAVGCGDNGLGMVRVTGTVTFDGAPPPAEGRLGFTPIEAAEGLPRRPGTGKFDSRGRFTVSSFKKGDGLVPGRYRVTVTCRSGPIYETMTKQQMDAVSYVAPGFENPELVVEVGSGSVTYDLDVSRRK